MAFSDPLTTEVTLRPLIKPCVSLSSPKADPETKTWMPVISWERISRNTVRMQRKDKEALTKGRFTGWLLGAPLCWGLCLETGSHCVTLTALKFNIETWLTLSSQGTVCLCLLGAKVKGLGQDSLLLGTLKGPGGIRNSPSQN